MTTKFLELKEGRIAYDESGAGRLVLCAPGMGDLRGEYRFLAPRLKAAGCRVVTIDPRGQGESSADWSDYGVGGIASDLLALIRHLQAGPAVLIGTSMAAGAAVIAAAREPQSVSALILIGAFVRDTAPAWRRRLMVDFLFPRLWGRWVWKKYFASLYPSSKPDDFDDYLARLTANLDEPGRFSALRQMMLATKREAEEDLRRVKAPTLVLMGGKDPDFDDPAEEARWIAERLDGAYEIIPGAGHYPHAEYPNETAPRIIDFLARQFGASIAQPTLAAAPGRL